MTRRTFLRPQPHRGEGIDAATVAVIEAVLRSMEPIRRQALLLHRIERLSYADIGERLSLSRAEVIMAIAQAIAELAIGLARQQKSREEFAESRRSAQDSFEIADGGAKRDE